MVMAEPSLQDAELKSQSVGVSTPSDAPATTTDDTTVGGDLREGEEVKENGLGVGTILMKNDDQVLEDGSARSDTDHSRSGSIAGDGKLIDLKPVKKFAVNKPVSFAKYSVPKVVATNSPIKTTVDKAPSALPTPTSASALGRPRLVAKSTGLLQQKPSAFKPATPDPMQVWNKNRVTPQPSTKHLTDEELKQQYGIHLTSRLQSDGEGKEAKWADIDDDDEDDWAPETIEWNDGTKTTVNPAETPVAKQGTTINTTGTDSNRTESSTQKVLAPQFSSTIGPNATVLRLGANAERQQLQKAAAQQARNSGEKTSGVGSKNAPAPTPVRSPWAKLPAIDKVSPIEINPQQAVTESLQRHAPGPTTVHGSDPALQMPSPAKEISADDFSRSWRDSSSNSNRELFMPNSGRYESVPENRRRLSRNDQNFRAPAVLQRPSISEPRGPAEPSAAFQTHRTSIDQGRRRASSSISGGSGQIARRMSLKSNEAPIIGGDGRRGSQVDGMGMRQLSQDPISPALATPAYQARGDYLGNQPGVPLDGDIEAQRAAQKAAMRENIERARKRKIEEEQRLEAEKQERIRAKLASLGPAPPQRATKAGDFTQSDSPETNTYPETAISSQSPPKPPQPLATGEPQQYGMMKVHALDTVKRSSPDTLRTSPESQPVNGLNQQVVSDADAAAANVGRGSNGQHDSQDPFAEEDANPEPSPKFSKSSTSAPGARAGWTSIRNDHRQQQSSNLWGLPSNKALGNGTFDHSLAGYSPQDLSRTSSSGQPWLNGRTPTVGQSPQMHHTTTQVPETRSQLLQSMTSPSQQPLSLNSEIDPVLPASRPAPIGPPPQSLGPNHSAHIPNNVGQQNNGLAAWNDFHNVARSNDKTDAERYQREVNERRDEERRTGVRQQAPYNFNETFKQVQLGEQAGQRHVASTAQNVHLPNGMFGAVGSLSSAEPPPRVANGQTGRGSRFFPVNNTSAPTQDRRAVTLGHIEFPRTPSPPPAEEYSSLHPAFEGNFYRPVVHFPREKAVVRLPPPVPPTPEMPAAPAQVQDIPPSTPKTPMTWAARVSMPAPTPAVRSVSSPAVQGSSWQERFNGLLGRKEAAARLAGRSTQPVPTLAVTRESLDVLPVIAASVSFPGLGRSITDSGPISSKEVEDEEDLFEDREAGSLPIIHLPRHVTDILMPRISIPRSVHLAIDPMSVHMFMVSNWSERHAQQKPQYAIIRAPGADGKGIRKDLVANGAETTPPKPRNASGHFSHKYARGKSGFKPRGTTKAH